MEQHTMIEMQPNEIQAVSNDMFIQMNQIAREIMEDRWLQNLKKECKTIIAEEQEKATAPEVIKEQVDALILQKIKALQQVEESAELQQEEIVQMDQDLLAKAEKIIRPLLLEKEAAQQEISEEVAEFLEEVKKECANFIAYYKQEKGPKLEIFDLIYNAINDRLAQLDETMRYREVPPEEITETVLQASRELQEFAYPVLSEFDKDTRVELELDVNDLHHRLLHNLKKECETIIADGQENGKTSGDIADQIQQKVSKIAVSHRETMKNHGVPPEEIEGKASLFLQELKRTVTPFLQKPQESRKRDFSAMMTSPTTTHDDPNIGASSSASPHLPQRKGLRP